MFVFSQMSKILKAVQVSLGIRTRDNCEDQGETNRGQGQFDTLVQITARLAKLNGFTLDRIQ